MISPFFLDYFHSHSLSFMTLTFLGIHFNLNRTFLFGGFSDGSLCWIQPEHYVSGDASFSGRASGGL